MCCLSALRHGLLERHERTCSRQAALCCRSCVMRTLVQWLFYTCMLVRSLMIGLLKISNPSTVATLQRLLLGEVYSIPCFPFHAGANELLCTRRALCTIKHTFHLCFYLYSAEGLLTVRGLPACRSPYVVRIYPCAHPRSAGCNHMRGKSSSLILPKQVHPPRAQLVSR